MNILVLDVGTSSMRGTLLDDQASILWGDQIRYHPTYRGKDRVEQSPRDWSDALARLCKAAASGHAVDAVALTSQRSSVIAVDAAGVPVADAIMWQDTRNKALCDSLAGQDARVRAICGTGINTVYSGGKMAWFRRNEPELYQKTGRFFVIPDYLLFQMTGRRVTDHTYGSRSMLMNLRERVWSPELLALFGVERDKLCGLIPPSSVAGTVTRDFARATGLRENIPVITCGGDQQCGALGQGVIAPGTASVNLGTGAYLIAAVDCVPEDAAQRGLVCNASAIPGQFILESSVLTCGAALDWYLREFCVDNDPAQVGEALRVSPPGAKGALVLPYFQGRSNPEWDSDARALFHGISLSVTRLDLLRALLEGICCEISRHVGLIGQLQPVDVLCVSGGLTQTEEMNQLLSDVCGKIVICRGAGDATTRGAWMSAAHCLGLVGSWSEAWEIVRPREQKLYRPRQELSAFYHARQAKMERLYQEHAARV